MSTTDTVSRDSHQLSRDKSSLGQTPGSLLAIRMSPTPIEKSQAELASLKERLRRHDSEGAKLDRDLAAAIERARAARLPMDEIANHAGVTRATLYNALRRATSQAAKRRPGTSPTKPQKR